MADGSSFWYAEVAPANTVSWKLEPKANSKTPLFDTMLLRRALTPLLGHGLPFDNFTFVDKSEKAVKFSVEDKVFVLRLDTYPITLTLPVSKQEQHRLIPQITRKGAGYPDLDLMEILSPDGRWFAFLKDHDVWLRSTADDTRVQLTSDGIAGYEWRDVPVRTYSKWASWSPDSGKLAIKKGDYRKVPKIPIIDYLKPREEARWISYSRAGEPIPRTELFIVDILSQKRTTVGTGLGLDQYALIIGWRNDGSELLFYRMDLLGADFVMLGGMFAGHTESGGELVERNGKSFKQFYGMSSSTAMKKHIGEVAEYRASEGKIVEVPFKGNVDTTLQDILGGLRSTCTYVGAQREFAHKLYFIISLMAIHKCNEL